MHFKYGKVLILNPDYKGKGHMESISSNPARRMEQCCPPKIYGPSGMMEFSDDNTKEEKDAPSDKFMVTLAENRCFRGASRGVTPSGL
jgi:hypothetical protein